MNITHTIKVRMTNVLLALLLVCGASSVSVQSAQASTDDNFPKILDSVSLVVNIIEEKIAEEGVPLAQSSTVATDPTIASLIALLNQLIAQYQALLAQQTVVRPTTSVGTPQTTAATGTISTTARTSSIAGMNANAPFTLKGTANGTYVYFSIDGGAREKLTVTGGAWTKTMASGLSGGTHTVTLYASATNVTALHTKSIQVFGDTSVNASTGTITITSPKAGEVYKVGDTIHVTWDNQNACEYGTVMSWLHDRNDDGDWETGSDILYSSTESAAIMKRGYYDYKIPSIYNSVAGTSAVYKNAIHIVCNAGNYRVFSGKFRVDLASGVQATKSNKLDSELVKGTNLGTIPSNTGIYKAQYVPPSVIRDNNDVWDVTAGTSMDIGWELIGQRYVYLNFIQDTNGDGIFDSVQQITKYDTNYGIGHTQRNYTWTAGSTYTKGIPSKIIVSKEPMTSININPAESVISGSKTFIIK